MDRFFKRHYIDYYTTTLVDIFRYPIKIMVKLNFLVFFSWLSAKNVKHPESLKLYLTWLDLVFFAEKFKFSGLKGLEIMKIIEHLNTENVCKAILMCEKLTVSDMLFYTCLNIVHKWVISFFWKILNFKFFIFRNYHLVIKTEDWNKLPSNLKEKVGWIFRKLFNFGVRLRVL